MREISVDLPALGNPTRPTSANSLSSRRRRSSWPGLPGSCSVGAWCVAGAKRALRLVLGIKTELDERVSMLGGNDEDVAAAAAIAAAGASARNIFLAAKG